VKTRVFLVSMVGAAIGMVAACSSDDSPGAGGAGQAGSAQGGAAGGAKAGAAGSAQAGTGGTAQAGSAGSLGNPDAGPIGCNSAMECMAPCIDMPCVDACAATITTPNGHTLLDAILACGNAACPGTAGGPCEDPSAQACYDCWEAIYTTTCKAEMDACKQDG
jgi:hypothetical protein